MIPAALRYIYSPFTLAVDLCWEATLWRQFQIDESEVSSSRKHVLSAMVLKQTKVDIETENK